MLRERDVEIAGREGAVKGAVRAPYSRLFLPCLGYGLFFSVCPLGHLGTATLLQSVADWRGILCVRLVFLICTAGSIRFLASRPVRIAPWRSLAVAGLAGQVVLYVGGATGFGLPAAIIYALLFGPFAGAYKLGWSEVLTSAYVEHDRTASITLYGLAFIIATVFSAAEPLAGAGGVASLIFMLVFEMAAWALLETIGHRIGARDGEGAGDGEAVPHIPIYARAVVLSLGATWALEFNLAVDLGFASPRGYLETLALTLLLYGACEAAIVALVRMTKLGTTHFSLMLRWVVVFVGIGWSLIPVLNAHAPRFACATCVMMFLIQSIIVTQFTIEICDERRLPFRTVLARCSGPFVLAACIASLLFLMLRSFLSSWTLYSLVAAAAVSVSLLVVPMLPSRSGGAGMFMFDTLPEDESIDGRVERAKQELATESGLTARETEVLDLMLAGLSRDDIAQRLALSSWTVKNHCRSIYAKTGTHSAKELMGQIYGNR